MLREEKEVIPGQTEAASALIPVQSPLTLGQLVSWDSASFKILDLIPAAEGAFVESLDHLQCIPAFPSDPRWLAKCGRGSPLGELDRELRREDPAPHGQAAPRQLLCPPCDVLFFISGPSLHLFPII